MSVKIRKEIKKQKGRQGKEKRGREIEPTRARLNQSPELLSKDSPAERRATDFGRQRSRLLVFFSLEYVLD